ncbi:MAG TPA: hypothetical protein VHX36_06585 [Candidatus Acidoferrales bacterium]|jgi:hypothetical protein|nr:hypothetical protein [Candidatus Acidoferrales bacterium]
MGRGFAAAMVMVLGGAVASAAAQAPLRLEATAQVAVASPASGKATGAQTAAQGGPTTATSGQHFVTVKFDYDFARTPACSSKVKKACVEKFVAYDISGGVKHRVKLFEIPLPSKPVGLVPGIKQKSPEKLDFESGKHLISVVAHEPDGRESLDRACTTWIEIP